MGAASLKDTAVLAPVSRRLDWLDALRGWAIFGVVLVHSGEIANVTGIISKISEFGRFGVQLFFVISALTISITYESHIAQFGKSARSQLAWLIKRFFRIAPLYYLAAILYPLFYLVLYGISQHRLGSIPSIPDMLANFLFVHAWVPSAINSVVPGGWSIGVEMFFYALVPFIWFIAPVPRRVIWLGLGAIVCLAITMLACKLSTGKFDSGEGDSFFGLWFPTQAPVFALGLIFYFLYGSRLRTAQSQKTAILWFGAFLAYIMTFLLLWMTNLVVHFATPTVVAGSFILLILSLHGGVKTVIANKYAILLGRISFSVYIFHFIVLYFIGTFLGAIPFGHSLPDVFALLLVFTAALALTSVVALVSKRIIEDPAITYGHKLSRSVALNLSGTRGSACNDG